MTNPGFIFLQSFSSHKNRPYNINPAGSCCIQHFPGMSRILLSRELLSYFYRAVLKKEAD
jgi:hypothetical protein